MGCWRTPLYRASPCVAGLLSEFSPLLLPRTGRCRFQNEFLDCIHPLLPPLPPGAAVPGGAFPASPLAAAADGR